MSALKINYELFLNKIRQKVLTNGYDHDIVIIGFQLRLTTLNKRKGFVMAKASKKKKVILSVLLTVVVLAAIGGGTSPSRCSATTKTVPQPLMRDMP